MSLFFSRLCVGVRSSSSVSFLLLSNGFSTSLRQTSPCHVLGARPCLEFSEHNRLGTLSIGDVNPEKHCVTRLEKKVCVDLVHNDLSDSSVVTIGASHGWVASLNKDDGILRLHDDLNPYALYKDPICIPLPPLVTLPHCQTKIITNVSMSSPSPEDDEDCVVAVKFLGPQLSFCKPAGKKSSKPEWTNVKIEYPCFYSSRVMFSKYYNMFLIFGSGGHLICAFDPTSDDLVYKSLRFENPPKLPTHIRELMNSCCMSQHLVESSTSTNGELFLVKQYRKTADIVEGVAKMKTEYVMVYKIDEQGNGVYTQDMGDLTMFLSNSEPFCIPSTSFPGFRPNWVYIKDFDETTFVDVELDGCPFFGLVKKNPAPYYIPPQNIVDD
ncbi:unnamed protein product [Eruca vesicaria subsp. sativa]|uniref:KIB1-4 beta-propeller domain-containing protein n=1 Tax=Eruca vesicaria subsp. sativa TaxID=29727 RepID=A0ABC8KI06_ERUVS|nr:unnamed protein product [Eruca vesicaria subsp. sativa]